MKQLDTELMVLTSLSVLLWGLAFIYNQPFATGVFAAITCGALVTAGTL